MTSKELREWLCAFALMTLAICAVIGILRPCPAWPATNEASLFFPLEYKDCEVKKNRVVLTSWYNLVRVDCNGKKYQAINIPARKSSKVFAIKSGKPVDVEYNRITGMTLVVQSDDGTKVLYSHLSRVAVQSGLIKAGDYIANVGRSGRTTGYHLRIQMLDSEGRPLCFTNDFGITFYLQEPTDIEAEQI